MVDELRCTPRTVTLAFTGSPEELFTIYRTCFGDDGWTASLTATSQEAVRMPSGVRARVLP